MIQYSYLLSNVWRKQTDSSVWKDQVTIPMFGIIRSEFQCREEIRSEFLCLKGSDHNSNVWKSKVNILMFKEMRSEFQY